MLGVSRPFGAKERRGRVGESRMEDPPPFRLPGAPPARLASTEDFGGIPRAGRIPEGGPGGLESLPLREGEADWEGDLVPGKPPAATPSSFLPLSGPPSGDGGGGGGGGKGEGRGGLDERGGRRPPRPGPGPPRPPPPPLPGRHQHHLRLLLPRSRSPRVCRQV